MRERCRSAQAKPRELRGRPQAACATASSWSSLVPGLLRNGRPPRRICKDGRAEAMAADWPQPPCRAHMTKERAREGRIFVDYLRNGRGATAVAAYSTRARAGAAVSTPLGWRRIVRGDQGRLLSGSAISSAGSPTCQRDPWADIFPRSSNQRSSRRSNRPRACSTLEWQQAPDSLRTRAILRKPVSTFRRALKSRSLSRSPVRPPIGHACPGASHVTQNGRARWASIALHAARHHACG